MVSSTKGIDQGSLSAWHGVDNGPRDNPLLMKTMTRPRARGGYSFA
ncbi:hypothetical protein QO004_004226 [Rhizobium mesoamericanum]|nr:hypothetical protein [Rhizobium mesoamericanum]